MRAGRCRSPRGRREAGSCRRRAGRRRLRPPWRSLERGPAHPTTARVRVAAGGRQVVGGAGGCRRAQEPGGQPRANIDRGAPRGRVRGCRVVPAHGSSPERNGISLARPRRRLRLGNACRVARVAGAACDPRARGNSAFGDPRIPRRRPGRSRAICKTLRAIRTSSAAPAAARFEPGQCTDGRNCLPIPADVRAPSCARLATRSSLVRARRWIRLCRTGVRPVRSDY